LKQCHYRARGPACLRFYTIEVVGLVFRKEIIQIKYSLKYKVGLGNVCPDAVTINGASKLGQTLEFSHRDPLPCKKRII
jgi:hypothetical protein